MIADINLGIKPPEVLGERVVTVKLGQTVTITAAMLQNSIPPYFQIDGYNMGAVLITGHNNTPTTLLAQTNQSDTIAYFMNGSNRIFKTGTVISNANVAYSVLSTNNFKVTGVALGSSYVTYRATAINTAGTEMSEYSTVVGRIKINVVPATNQPPDACNDTVVNIPMSGGIIEASKFIEGYHDPDGDVPSKVRFDEIPPLGLTLLNGVPVTVGTITSMQMLEMVGLTYIPDQILQSVGDTTQLRWAISDVGSEQFYTN